MDFNFTEDQQHLRDAVAKWVHKAYGLERRRAVVAEGGFSAQVYVELAELGLTGLTIPEQYGGLGMGPIESMVVMEELGRGIVIEPLIQSLIAGIVLGQYASPDLAQAWCPKVASGKAIVVLAHQERKARYRLAECTTQAQADGSGFHLSGAKSLVPVGDRADAYIIPAVCQSKLGLYLVQSGAARLTTRAYQTQDGGRASELKLDKTPATQLIANGITALEHAVDVGIAALCAQAVGAMEKTLAITVEYMNTRKQFGVTLATFQALRHRMADMKMELELGRSMSYYASLKLTADTDERRRAISRAKYQLGRSMRHVGQEAIQLHGGIGVTDEYILSHYFKSLTQMEMSFGDTLHHLGQVSARMQDSAGVFA